MLRQMKAWVLREVAVEEEAVSSFVTFTLTHWVRPRASRSDRVALVEADQRKPTGRLAARRRSGRTFMHTGAVMDEQVYTQEVEEEEPLRVAIVLRPPQVLTAVARVEEFLVPAMQWRSVVDSALALMTTPITQEDPQFMGVAVAEGRASIRLLLAQVDHHFLVLVVAVAEVTSGPMTCWMQLLLGEPMVRTPRVAEVQRVQVAAQVAAAELPFLGQASVVMAAAVAPQVRPRQLALVVRVRSLVAAVVEEAEGNRLHLDGAMEELVQEEKLLYGHGRDDDC